MTLSSIQKLAAAGKPIYVVEGKQSDDPDVYGGKGVPGAPEWQFSDGPSGKRGTSEDFQDLREGLAHYREVNPEAVFIFDLDEESEAAQEPEAPKYEDLSARLHVTLGACVTVGLHAGAIDRKTVAQHLATLFGDQHTIESCIERIEIAELVTDDEVVMVSGDTSPPHRN